jgi:hypothetical protein
MKIKKREISRYCVIEISCLIKEMSSLFEMFIEQEWNYDINKIMLVGNGIKTNENNLICLLKNKSNIGI